VSIAGRDVVVVVVVLSYARREPKDKAAMLTALSRVGVAGKNWRGR
jgi:hypothetical protein